ncbi:MAG TPA: TIGR03089 family protein, partial [Friedmanniella sp.]
MPLIADLLARRVRSDGSAPLVTYYDTDAGVRTELSATTVSNWVAKTSNLLTDELMASPGSRVELLLAER